jgi:hypothetical protein
MKTCLGCKFAEWDWTKTGRLHPSGDGECIIRVKTPQLPNAFYTFGTNNNLTLLGGHINRRHEYKTHCPYYQGPEYSGKGLND